MSEPTSDAAIDPAPGDIDDDLPSGPALTPEQQAETTEAYWMLVEAGKLWAEACGYFGDPREMFRHPFMRARQRSIAADWIRCLEMLVRRIILMIALKLELPTRKPRATPQSTDAAKPPMPRKASGPFKALRPTLTIMPCVQPPRRSNKIRRPNPISQLRLHTLARRLTAIQHAIVNAHIYARRTAFSLAQIAERHRNTPHPLISLNPWLIREEKRTSGQDRMYDQIEHAQVMCLEQLDLWHGRMPEPG